MGGSKELKAAISTVLAMVGGNAAAQSAGGGDADDSALQEVIVTATRRAERMQDIPESISAFSTDDIAKRGLTQMDDYARLVPGLSISDREPGGTSVVFRGVASSGLQFGAVSSSVMATRSWSTMSPASVRSVMKWSVTPVSLSPCTSTRLRGQRPR